MGIIHKLGCDIRKKTSYVLCTGKPDRLLSKVAYFWASVTCKACLAKKKVK